MNVQWSATYRSGETLRQVSPDGSTMSYDALPNRDEIVTFDLVDLDSGRKIFTLHLDAGQKLVYRRRTLISPGVRTEIVYVVGWRRSIGDVNVQSIAYVFEETGAVEMAGDFRSRHRFFYSPVLRECER